MAPHSPGTDQIDTLLWVGLVVAILIVLAIGGLVLVVVRRNRAHRGAEPRQITGSSGTQIPVVATLSALALALFVISVVITDEARETPSTGPTGLVSAKGEPRQSPLNIKVTGQQWLWRYDYPNGAFSYYKLVVPANTAINLEIVSTDVVHTWNVGDLTPKADAVPGKTHNIGFETGDEGTYTGDAATLNGQAYAAMRSEVEVVSPDEYNAFVKQQKAEIEEAQKKVVGEIENGEVP